MPVLRCRTLPSVLPCFIYGQECPCSVVGRYRRSCHALSTGRNARAPLSDVPVGLTMLYLRAGMPVLRCRTFPSVLPCFIHGQECPCSVLSDDPSPSLPRPQMEFSFSFSSLPFRLPCRTASSYRSVH